MSHFTRSPDVPTCLIRHSQVAELVAKRNAIRDHETKEPSALPYYETFDLDSTDMPEMDKIERGLSIRGHAI